MFWQNQEKHLFILDVLAVWSIDLKKYSLIIFWISLVCIVIFPFPNDSVNLGIFFLSFVCLAQDLVSFVYLLKKTALRFVNSSFCFLCFRFVDFAFDFQDFLPWNGLDLVCSYFQYLVASLHYLLMLILIVFNVSTYSCKFSVQDYLQYVLEYFFYLINIFIIYFT